MVGTRKEKEGCRLREKIGLNMHKLIITKNKNHCALVISSLFFFV
jgi:hypothetical protein